MIDFFALPTVIQGLFIPLCFCAYFLYVSGQRAVTELVQNREFASFQNVYFLPYFMALFADWLQGPYVYKLYSYYGFPQDQIAILYVVGFASSVVFGTTTGPIADKFGRKKMLVIFCIIYSLCCLTKMFPNFLILLIGRVLGGVATSILFSVFESWYMHEHTITWKYPMDWVSLTFSKATFFNGLLAIIAGIMAQGSSDWLNFGPVSPFILAMPFLIVAAILISLNWTENYGERNLEWSRSCMEGYRTIMQNKNILALGIVQSLFESNMYIFVFLWTPVLEPGTPPLGLTFASFMVAIMIGSSIYSILLKKTKPTVILRYCVALSGASFIVCSITSSPEFKEGLVVLSFVSFLLLEISVGMYFPCIARLRGEVIPDALRANIMNWFRVPMNVITCAALMGMHGVSKENGRANQLVFLMCSGSAFLGYLVSVSFSKMTSRLVVSAHGDSENLLKTEKHEVVLEA